MRNDKGYKAPEFKIPQPEEGWDARDEFVAQKRIEERKTLPEDELLAKRLKGFERMGIPRRVWELLTTKADKRDHNKALQAMRDFLDMDMREKSIAMMLGGTGCGKTLAASLWLWNVKSPEFPGTCPKKFITSTEFCSMSSFDDAKAKLVFKASFLVIDDAGEDYADKRDYNGSRLAYLMGQRHADMLPTVISSNLHTEKFEAAYGDRIASRMNDAVVTNLKGEPDMRKKR